MRQIVLDTETTGLQIEEGHRIIEIGCIELINRKLTGKRYHQYINPERPIEEEALAIHGITEDFLKNKPPFREIAKEFIEFITNAELIIHNAPFDTAFINHELQLTQQKWKSLTTYCCITDTLLLARQLHVGQRNSLDALCKRYGVDHSSRDFHGALLDARLLAEVYLNMTGGQSSLFEENLSINPIREEKIQLKDKQTQKRNLIVLLADANELNAHHLKLKEIAEKGRSLWEES
ncbi:MAG: DNA polymerase III, epsilon chain [uncultured bacterium]|nr:MAG: DNA polymerase III, epsilon chain [uncultured bacterium]